MSTPLAHTKDYAKACAGARLLAAATGRAVVVRRNLPRPGRTQLCVLGECSPAQRRGLRRKLRAVLAPAPTATAEYLRKLV